MPDAIADHLIRLVEQIEGDHEERIGLTLLVGGAVITGHISPMHRFETWLDKYTAPLMEHGKGGISAHKPVEMLDWYKVRDHRNKHIEPAPATRETAICLRNARIMAPAPPTGPLSFLLVRIADVSGFSLADMSEAAPD